MKEGVKEDTETLVAVQIEEGKMKYFNYPQYFNYSHYVRTEDEANRLLEGLLKRKNLREGWTSNDGSKTHPWVVRGVKRRKR